MLKSDERVIGDLNRMKQLDFLRWTFVFLFKHTLNPCAKISTARSEFQSNALYPSLCYMQCLVQGCIYEYAVRLDASPFWTLKAVAEVVVCAVLGVSLCVHTICLSFSLCMCTSAR